MWLKFQFLFGDNIADSLFDVYKKSWIKYISKLGIDEEIEFIHCINSDTFINDIKAWERIVSLYYIHRRRNWHDESNFSFLNSISSWISKLQETGGYNIDTTLSLLILILWSDNKYIHTFKERVADIVKKVPCSVQWIRSWVLCLYDNYDKQDAFSYLSTFERWDFHKESKYVFMAYTQNIKEFIIFIIEDLISSINNPQLQEECLLALMWDYLKVIAITNKLISENQEQTTVRTIKCLFNHIFDSNKICTSLISISFNMNQSSAQSFKGCIKEKCLFFYIEVILQRHANHFIFKFLKLITKDITLINIHLIEVFDKSMKHIIHIIKTGINDITCKNRFIIIKDFLVFIYKETMKHLSTESKLNEIFIWWFHSFIHDVLIPSGWIFSTTLLNFVFWKEVHHFSIMEFVINTWSVQDKSADNNHCLLEKFSEVIIGDVGIIYYYDCINEELKYHGKVGKYWNNNTNLLKEFNESIKIIQGNKILAQDKSMFWVFLFKQLQQDADHINHDRLEQGFNLMLQSKKMSTSKYDFESYNNKIKIIIELKNTWPTCESQVIKELLNVINRDGPFPIFIKVNSGKTENKSSSFIEHGLAYGGASLNIKLKKERKVSDVPHKSTEKLHLRKSDVIERKDIQIKRKNSFKACEYCTTTLKENNNTISTVSNTIAQKKQKQNFNLMFFDITTPNCILCLKRDLLLKQWSVYFIDIFFKDKDFNKIVSIYTYQYINEDTKWNKSATYNNNISLQYPSTIRNYSICKSYYPKIFLKKDMRFYNSPYISISHSYLTEKFIASVQPTPKHQHVLNIPKCWLSNLKVFKCEVMNHENIIFGRIYLSDDFVIFESENDLNDYNTNLDFIFSVGESELIMKEKQIIILLKTVEELIARNFLYMPQAMELFWKNGKSYFFNLFSDKSMHRFMEEMIRINTAKSYGINIIKDQIEYFLNKSNHYNQWWNNSIDNLQYLWYLNKYSNRSYNDLNQYPIMPWVILDNISSALPQGNCNTNNIKSNFSIRDFLYPISAQTRENRDKSINYFQFLKEEDGKPCHFRLHYSTSSYVLLYLARLNPYTNAQIKFQNNAFDNPNRQFTSFKEWISIWFNNNDNRELIPDLFLMVEFFYNLNRNFFGKKSPDNVLVNNVQIPFCFNSPTDFIYNQRIKINSEEMSKKLLNWIDNIFGYYQTTTEESRCNTFNKYSYNIKVNWSNKLKKFRDDIQEGKWDEQEVISKIKNKKLRIWSFGQCPLRLFNKHHKYENLKIEKNDEISLLLSMPLKHVKIEGSQVLWISWIKNTDKLFFLLKGFRNKEYTIAVYHSNEIRKLEEILIDNIKIFRKVIPSSGVASSGRDAQSRIPKNNFTNTENKMYYYTLHPKYALIDLFNGKVFVTGRNYDNSIRVYKDNQRKGDMPNSFYSILTDSFVSCIYKINDGCFYTGHRNGKLIEWSISKDVLTQMEKGFWDNPQCPFIKLNRSIWSHYQSMITAITYVKRHELLVTSSLNGHMHIRKAYDFEWMNIITLNQISPTCYFTDIVISHSDFIYTMAWDTSRNSENFSLFAYTMNGLWFANKSNYNFRNIYVSSKGKVIVGLANNGKIYVFDGGDDFKRKEYSFKPEGAITQISHNKNTKHHQSRSSKLPEVCNVKQLNYFVFNEDVLCLCFCLYNDGTFIKCYDATLEKKLN